MKTATASTQTRRAEDKENIRKFLRSHSVGTLGTVDRDGNPHIAIIYFSLGNKFEVTFTTKRQTHKHRNIAHNNRVMLIAYEAFSQTTVQISGTAKEITNLDEAGEAFKNTLKSSLKTSGIGIPPISKMYAGDYVAYRIIPEQINMIVFSRANPSNYQIYDTPRRKTEII